VHRRVVVFLDLEDGVEVDLADLLCPCSTAETCSRIEAATLTHGRLVAKNLLLFSEVEMALKNVVEEMGDDSKSRFNVN
jgi:hypothetical protein